MTIHRSLIAARAALALAICLAPAATTAAPTPDQSCRAAKLKAAGKYTASVAGCHAKAATDASAVDGECLTKALDKLTGAFEKANEKGDCSGLLDSTTEDADALVAAVLAAAPSAPAGGKCPSGIYKSGGKLASGQLSAWSKFVTTGDATKRDDSITKATTKLVTSVGKAEEKDGCTGTGQAAAIENAVETGIEPLLACLAGTGSCAEEEVGAGETVTTDPEGDGPDAETPVVATIETPVAGTVTMHVVDGMPPSGYALLGQTVVIDAPDATAAAPLVLTFVIDASLLPMDPLTVALFRNGILVPDCTGADGVADPDPCVDSRTVLAGGDLQIVAFTSQASEWGAGTAVAPTTTVTTTTVTMTTSTTIPEPPADYWMRWQVRADKVGDDVATEIDIGWTGGTHDIDPVDGSAMRFGLSCPSASPPTSYGECTVTGFDPAENNCRCANNTATICDEPLVADADDCSGAICNCYTRPPLPAVTLGTSICMVGLANSDASGTWNPDTGSGDVELNEYLKLHLGYDLVQPCPVCVGDPTPNDGARGGTCDVGQTAGAPCDAMGSDPTYPVASGGGSTSLDCMPSVSSNISGIGMKFPHVESTGSVSLAASMPCLGNPAEDCPCAACSTDPSVGCASDAECLETFGMRCSLDQAETCTTNADCSAVNQLNCHASLLRCTGDFDVVCATNSDCAAVDAGPCEAPTCDDNGQGTYPDPNYCLSGTCNAGGDGEGQCDDLSDTFCDALVEEDGKPLVSCQNNSDCGFYSAGNCTVSVPRNCFGPTITAAGVADPDSPRTVAALCIGALSNGGANAASGLPGPARLRTDWSVTYGE
jgi:hypothetical protein